MTDFDALLLEDLSIPVMTFLEFKILKESYHNFFPSDVAKKTAHAKEVFDLVQKSYADQGGIKGSGFSSPEDMVKNIPMWKLSKKDGKVNSAALYKDTQGRKRVAAATDGTPEGKKAAAGAAVGDLKQQRAHMELSGKSLSFVKKLIDLKDHLHTFDSAEKFHKSRGDTITRPSDDDKEVIRHPELKDHMYSRNIGGHIHTKVMMGTMGKPIVEVFTKDEEKENGKDSTLRQGVHKYNNWSFDAQLHGPSQAKERRSDWKESDWNDLLSRAHAAITDTSKHIVSKGKTPTKVETGSALFYSKSKQQAVVMRIAHKDPKNPKLGGTTRLETILPQKQSIAKEGTQRIVIEGVLYEECKNLFVIE